MDRYFRVPDVADGALNGLLVDCPVFFIRRTSLSTPPRSASPAPPPASSRNRAGNAGEGSRHRTSARVLQTTRASGFNRALA